MIRGCSHDPHQVRDPALRRVLYRFQPHLFRVLVPCYSASTAWAPAPTHNSPDKASFVSGGIGLFMGVAEQSAEAAVATLFRLVIVLAILTGIGFAAMYALATFFSLTFEKSFCRSPPTACLVPRVEGTRSAEFRDGRPGGATFDEASHALHRFEARMHSRSPVDEPYSRSMLAGRPDSENYQRIALP